MVALVELEEEEQLEDVADWYNRRSLKVIFCPQVVPFVSLQIKRIQNTGLGE